MKWAHVTFQCSHCGVVFPDGASLKAHAARHSGRVDDAEDQGHVQPTVAFACSHCDSVFENRWGLRAHLLQHGVVAATEYRPSADSKPRVTAIPFELSGRRRAGLTHETTPSREVADRRPRRRTLAKRLALVAAALLVIFLGVSSALAWWTTSASSSARITTGTWGNYLTFCPGASQATHYSSCGTAKQVVIASLDKQGNLSCDFGDALLGSTTSWPDVFRITSSAPAALKVSFTPSGAIAPFIASVTFAADTTGGVLNSKQTRDVAVQLTVPKTATPGTYAGTLTVAVVGGSESHTIPLTVRVLAQKPSHPKSHTTRPRPASSASSTPSPTPTASSTTSVSPKGSPSPTATPTASTSASAVPSPTPSATA